MKPFPSTACLPALLTGAVALLLLATAPARAALPAPQFGPPASALSPDGSALLGAVLSPAVLPALPAPDVGTMNAQLSDSCLWGPGGPPWNRATDPSLRLGDWRHVFDIAALGAFDVPLRDDPAERTNILLSASAVDNVTVAPGTEFSFNAQVGERTPERGYRDGLMFDSGHVIRGTGGGICLVATGLYDAALGAGLAITERHPHSGLVSYAPPGCDAGIVYGKEDLKFRNTTGRPLVIRATPEDDHVAVRLFGRTPPPGRRVFVRPLSLSTIPYAVVTKIDLALAPGQSIVDQKPRSGYEVVLARFWTQNGRVTRREIVTRERRAPRNKVLRIAPPPVVPVVAPPAPPTDPLLDLLGPGPGATDAPGA